MSHDFARQRVEQIQLAVMSDNEHARRLYARLGFLECGVEKKALKQDGQYFDEVLMAKDLDKPRKVTASASVSRTCLVVSVRRSVLFSWLPDPFAIYYWRRFFSNRMAEYVFARHALHASVEMQALAAECRLLVAKSGVPAPALNQLYRAVDDYAAPKLSGRILPSRNH